MQLDLSRNQLCGINPRTGEGTYTAEGITAIAEALKVTGSLTEVNLLKNDIGMEAANQLAAVLPQHKTLKTLCGFKPNQTEASFDNQGLKPADALLIAADLRVHGSLTSLNLNLNDIGNEGATHIAEALKVNGALTALK